MNKRRFYERMAPLAFAGALMAASTIGCEQPSGDASVDDAPASVHAPSLVESDSAGSKEPAADSTAGVDAVSLVEVDEAGLAGALAKLKGKVVLVDFWATWCPPCVKQLPHTLELAEKYSEEGLAVVTVSLDSVEESEMVRQRLSDMHAVATTNLISTYGASPESLESFEIDGAPHYKIYGRAGELQQSFGTAEAVASQAVTPELIEQRVQDVLGASKSGAADSGADG